MSSENRRGLTAPGENARNLRTFRGLLAPAYCDNAFLRLSELHNFHVSNYYSASSTISSSAISSSVSVGGTYSGSRSTAWNRSWYRGQ